MKFLEENAGACEELRHWKPDHHFLQLAPFIEAETVWSEMKAVHVMKALDAIAKDNLFHCIKNPVMKQIANNYTKLSNELAKLTCDAETKTRVKLATRCFASEWMSYKAGIQSNDEICEKEDIKCFLAIDGFNQVVTAIVASLDKGRNKRTRGPMLTTIAELLVTAKDDKGDSIQAGKALRASGSDTVEGDEKAEGTESEADEVAESLTAAVKAQTSALPLDLTEGTQVLTHSQRHKDKFDRKRGIIVTVLKKKYRVKLLDGIAKDQTQDFAKKDVEQFLTEEERVNKKRRLAADLFGKTLE